MGKRAKTRDVPQERKRGELLLSVTLADCDVQHFAAGGHGGQNQNKRHTGTRIIHRASGAAGESREQRSQLQNKKAAFRRMTDTRKFRVWLAKQAGADLIRETPEKIVQREMLPVNLRVEGKSGDDWVILE